MILYVFFNRYNVHVKEVFSEDYAAIFVHDSVPVEKIVDKLRTIDGVASCHYHQFENYIDRYENQELRGQDASRTGIVDFCDFYQLYQLPETFFLLNP